ncbi:hypothetical protein [Roseibium sp.]|uniref:hypothetical protein n=1 Tax=Roseibium sp. TaxID=1936156 RepID=UPI003B501ABD
MRKISFWVSFLLTFALGTIGVMAASIDFGERQSADSKVKEKIISAAENIQTQSQINRGLSIKRFAQWYNWNNWSNWPNWRNW